MKKWLVIINKFFWFFLMFAICFASSIFQNIAFGHAIIFFVYQCICILAVGDFVLRRIKYSFKKEAEQFVIKYAIGYGINILLYIIFFPIGGKIGLIVAMALLSGIALIDYFRNREKKDLSENLDKDIFVINIFLLGVVALQFFVYLANNMSPNITGVNSYYLDLLYWAADAVTFTKRFPPINFRGIGMDSGTYYYHYFSSIQVAVTSICTGIEVKNIVFGFSCVQSATLLVGSAYFLLRSISNKILHVVVGMALILFSTGLENGVLCTVISHLYSAPFGYDIGLSFAMLSLGIIVMQIKANKFEKKLFAMQVFAYFICAGAKGPIAMVLLSVYGIICAYWVLNPKNRNLKCGFMYGITLVIVFGVVFFCFTNGLPTGGSKVEQFITGGAAKSIVNGASVNGVYNQLKATCPYIIAQLLFMVYYIFWVNPALTIFLIVGGVICLIKIKNIDVLDVSLLIGILFGIMLVRVMNLTGYSQMYFMLSILPLMAIFGIKSIEKIYMSMTRVGKYVLYAAYGGFVLAGCCFFFSTPYLQTQLHSGVCKAIATFKLDIPHTEEMYLQIDGNGDTICKDIKNDSYTANHYTVITEEIYQVTEWLKENTDENSVIASDVLVTSYEYPIGVFAERWSWNANQDVISKAIAGDEDSIKALINNGVSYLLLKNEQGLNVRFVIKNPEYEIVYQNLEITVVKIAK